MMIEMIFVFDGKLQNNICIVLSIITIKMQLKETMQRYKSSEAHK